MSDEWIRADQIPALLQWDEANEYGQRVQLLNCLKGGRIAVKTDGAETERVVTNDKGQLEKNAETWRDWRDIPTTLWRDYPYHLNMGARTYSYTRKPDSKTREGDWLSVKLTGLSFSRPDILRELAAGENIAPTGEAKSKGGRPVDNERWADFAALFAAYAQSGGDIAPGEQAGRLYSKIMDFGASLGVDTEKALGVDTCRAAINHAMALVQAAENQTQINQ